MSLFVWCVFFRHFYPTRWSVASKLLLLLDWVDFLLQIALVYTSMCVLWVLRRFSNISNCVTKELYCRLIINQLFPDKSQPLKQLFNLYANLLLLFFYFYFFFLFLLLSIQCFYQQIRWICFLCDAYMCVYVYSLWYFFLLVKRILSEKEND